MPPLPSDPAPQQPSPTSTEPSGPQLPSNPAKAQSFCNYARREGMPPEGAYTYWMMGLREDPNNAQSLRDFLAYAATHRKEATALRSFEKDIRGDENPANGFCRALIALAMNPFDGKIAAAAVSCSAGYRLNASTEVLAGEALNVLSAGKTGKSDARAAYLAIIGVLRPLKLMDLAERAAQAVSALFPQDSALAALKRDVSAERYSVAQGLDQPIEQGTFRRNIRDAALQRRLEEEGRLGGAISDIDARVSSAQAKLESDPKDVHAVLGLAELLLRRAGEEDEQSALVLLSSKASEIGSSVLRSKSSDLRIKLLEREIKALEAAGPDKQSEAASKRREVLLIRREELELRVKEDSESRKHRHDLGRTLLDLGFLREAIPHLQTARDNPELVLSAGKALLQSYSGLGLYPEMVQAYRGILQSGKLTDSSAEELGRRVLDALIARAEDTRDPARATAAIAALDLASEMLDRKFEEGPLLAARQRVSGLIALLPAA